MPDEIERIIRRDLDQLPLLPRERWLPAAPGVSSRVRTGVFRMTAGLAVIALALVVGASLTQVRSDLAKSSNVAATATPSAGAPDGAGQGILSRQAAIARVAQLSAELPRIQRIEAKLVGADYVRSFNPAVASQHPGALWWLVAVSGDVRCSFCFTTPSAGAFHSAIYELDARTGDVGSVAAYRDDWPSGFDKIADQSLARNSVTLLVTIDAVTEPNTLVVTIVDGNGVHPKGEHLTLRADENTAFAWRAGDAGGTARSLTELAPVPGTTLLDQATFEDVPSADGSYRLERLVTGVNTR